jgi:hypothetical protein
MEYSKNFPMIQHMINSFQVGNGSLYYEITTAVEFLYTVITSICDKHITCERVYCNALWMIKLSIVITKSTPTF